MSSFQLAINTCLLTGKTDAEKVAQAKTVGADGIEVMADGLTHERVEALNAACDAHGLRVVSVHMGVQHDFLTADESRREAALDELRLTLTRASDLNADAVILVPQNRTTLDMPNLLPFKTPMELTIEMMVWHLRVFSDLAYVFGLKLYLQPRAPYQTAFLNRLEQGAILRERIKDNPYVLLAPDTHHMTTSETNLYAALQAHANAVNIIHLADNHGGLAGTGMLDFAAIRAALGQQDGWGILTQHHGQTPTTDGLAASVAHLRGAGFSA